jgi:hypothetical protein
VGSGGEEVQSRRGRSWRSRDGERSRGGERIAVGKEDAKR